MTNKQTNELDVIKFLSYAMPVVDAWTPTKINEGGCGVFAELLIKRLKKHKIPFKIWAVYLSDSDVSTNSEKLMNEYVKNGTFNEKIGVDHILTEIYDGFFIDSTGILNGAALAAWSKYELTEKQLHELNEKAEWNDTFDRGCIKTIEDKLDSFFKDFPEISNLKMPKPHEVKFTKHTLQYSGAFGIPNFLKNLASLGIKQSHSQAF